MIEGFEEQTQPLSEKEQRVLLPTLQRALLHYKTPEKAITAKTISAKFKQLGHNVPGARVRKLINVIRREHTFRDEAGQIWVLAASSKGYYLTRDEEDIERHIRSINSRVDAMVEVLSRMRSGLHKLRKEKQPEPISREPEQRSLF